jgi:hypothetical protein
MPSSAFSLSPLRWAQLMIVDDDAVYGAEDSMPRVRDWDKADRVHRWGCAFTIVRTWKTAEDQTLNHLIAHVPPFYQALSTIYFFRKSNRIGTPANPKCCLNLFSRYRL